MEKAGRNDPCPCGSGKKFKKCCESKSSLGILSVSHVIKGSEKMASLFQKQLGVLATSPMVEKKL